MMNVPGHGVRRRDSSAAQSTLPCGRVLPLQQWNHGAPPQATLNAVWPNNGRNERTTGNDRDVMGRRNVK